MDKAQCPTNHINISFCL